MPFRVVRPVSAPSPRFPYRPGSLRLRSVRLAAVSPFCAIQVRFRMPRGGTIGRAGNLVQLAGAACGPLPAYLSYLCAVRAAARRGLSLLLARHSRADAGAQPGGHLSFTTPFPGSFPAHPRSPAPRRAAVCLLFHCLLFQRTSTTIPLIGPYRCNPVVSRITSLTSRSSKRLGLRLGLRLRSPCTCTFLRST